MTYAINKDFEITGKVIGEEGVIQNKEAYALYGFEETNYTILYLIKLYSQKYNYFLIYNSSPELTIKLKGQAAKKAFELKIPAEYFLRNFNQNIKNHVLELGLPYESFFEVLISTLPVGILMLFVGIYQKFGNLTSLTPLPYGLTSESFISISALFIFLGAISKYYKARHLRKVFKKFNKNDYKE